MPQPSDFLYSENAYFYKIKDDATVVKKDHENVLKDAVRNKIKNYPVDEIYKDFPTVDPVLKYSMRIFKSEDPIPFNDTWNAPDSWKEVKIGYVLMIQYREYIVIFKRNSSPIKSLKDIVENLPYEKMLSLNIGKNTIFQKFTMDAMYGSKTAMRSRTYEADNLRESMSTLSASRQILKYYRARNEDEEQSFALATSRLNTFQNRKTFAQICIWVKETVDALITTTTQESILTVFAKAESYSATYKTLKPISILFLWHNLYNLLDKSTTTISFRRSGGNRPVSKQELRKYIYRFTDLIDVVQDLSKTNEYRLRTKGKYLGIDLVILSSGIRIRSEFAERIILQTSDGAYSLVDYINGHSLFNVFFGDIQLVYSNRHLFRDAHIETTASKFLKVFKPLKLLSRTTSEKGYKWLRSHRTQTTFPIRCVFGVVEKIFMSTKPDTYFICDDMGSEWADHIKIEPERVTFFISKHHDSICSASDFQDVVGQALKNLGNLTPSKAQLKTKCSLWRRNYVVANRQCGITRLRHGTNVTDAINLWKAAMNSPYFKKEVSLVVDFISISHLKTLLDNVKHGKLEKEAIQLFWLLSSFVSNCKDMDVEVNIYCKQ